MKKNLYIVRKEYDGFGGAENVAKRYVDGFNKQFFCNLIFAGCQLEGFKFAGTKGPGWYKSISFANSVNRFFAKKKDSIIFSMTRGVSGTVFRMGDGVHNQWLKRNKTGLIKRHVNPSHFSTPFLEKRSIQNSKWIVPNSELIKREVLSEYKVESRSLKVIHNGYSSKSFQFADEHQRLQLKKLQKINKSELTLFFCANGWKRKGLTHAIQFLSQLASLRKCHLWVAGRGDRKSHQRIAQKLGVSNCITFLGSISDTSTWYKTADLFVLPTQYDPFSNSCLEALACGCPVLTTSSNGASECINWANGLVIDNQDSISSGSVLQCIQSLINLPRKEISNSIHNLTSEKEISSYIKLITSDG